VKLIGLKKEGKSVSVQFYGCQLRCGYCTHLKQPRTEHELQEVLELIADPKVEEVYIGGAEPTVQKKELMELLRRLQRMNRRVTLKTNGHDPQFLRDSLGLVDMYILEIKCPLDDLDCIATLTGLSRERAEKYASLLKQSLEVLRGAKVRIWIRVIPGYVTLDKVERLGDQIAGTATEVYLIQFLSAPENDAPFDGIDTPSPAEGEMVAMARRLLEFVPNVYVRGRDFKSDFRAGRQ